MLVVVVVEVVRAAVAVKTRTVVHSSGYGTVVHDCYSVLVEGFVD